MSLDFRLRNQISKRRPLSPEFSVRPMSAVCEEEEKQSINQTAPGAKGVNCFKPVLELSPAWQT